MNFFNVKAKFEDELLMSSAPGFELATWEPQYCFHGDEKNLCN